MRRANEKILKIGQYLIKLRKLLDVCLYIATTWSGQNGSLPTTEEPGEGLLNMTASISLPDLSSARTVIWSTSSARHPITTATSAVAAGQRPTRLICVT